MMMEVPMYEYRIILTNLVVTMMDCVQTTSSRRTRTSAVNACCDPPEEEPLLSEVDRGNLLALYFLSGLHEKLTLFTAASENPVMSLRFQISLVPEIPGAKDEQMQTVIISGPAEVGRVLSESSHVVVARGT
ncbi:MAG: uncharacterized protein KVP18_004018 [Porospora cf. gigantea A]|uniref:uncharacterized protein n=1 Tax=Porospora cf. gigantea A TaxID=2853593 RepID=UPI00355ABF33|nr:MAG: hypothetical protein KVP18_004018 [Porospora cf. gigantea A]